jgi:hypothetical protein
MSEDQTSEVQQDELTSLKARADQLGLSYHPSIGVDKLRDKVNQKLSGDAEEAEVGTKVDTAKETTHEFRLRKRKEASALVRIQVTCMNPNKSEWDGEYICSGNSVVGTYKNFVPFNVEWHVPRIIFNQLRDRQCQIFTTKKTVRGGTQREGKLIREFSVVELPPLTEKELKELGQRQAMAAGSAA